MFLQLDDSCRIKDLQKAQILNIDASQISDNQHTGCAKAPW